MASANGNGATRGRGEENVEEKRDPSFSSPSHYALQDGEGSAPLRSSTSASPGHTTSSSLPHRSGGGGDENRHVDPMRPRRKGSVFLLPSSASRDGGGMGREVETTSTSPSGCVPGGPLRHCPGRYKDATPEEEEEGMDPHSPLPPRVVSTTPSYHSTSSPTAPLSPLLAHRQLASLSRRGSWVSKRPLREPSAKNGRGVEKEEELRQSTSDAGPSLTHDDEGDEASRRRTWRCSSQGMSYGKEVGPKNESSTGEDRLWTRRRGRRRAEGAGEQEADGPAPSSVASQSLGKSNVGGTSSAPDRRHSVPSSQAHRISPTAPSTEGFLLEETTTTTATAGGETPLEMGLEKKREKKKKKLTESEETVRSSVPTTSLLSSSTMTTTALPSPSSPQAGTPLSPPRPTPLHRGLFESTSFRADVFANEWMAQYLTYYLSQPASSSTAVGGVNSPLLPPTTTTTTTVTGPSPTSASAGSEGGGVGNEKEKEEEKGGGETGVTSPPPPPVVPTTSSSPTSTTAAAPSSGKTYFLQVAQALGKLLIGTLQEVEVLQLHEERSRRAKALYVKRVELQERRQLAQLRTSGLEEASLTLQQYEHRIHNAQAATAGIAQHLSQSNARVQRGNSIRLLLKHFRMFTSIPPETLKDVLQRLSQVRDWMRNGVTAWWEREQEKASLGRGGSGGEGSRRSFLPFYDIDPVMEEQIWRWMAEERVREPHLSTRDPTHALPRRRRRLPAGVGGSGEEASYSGGDGHAKDATTRSTPDHPPEKGATEQNGVLVSEGASPSTATAARTRRRKGSAARQAVDEEDGADAAKAAAAAGGTLLEATTTGKKKKKKIIVKTTRHVRHEKREEGEEEEQPGGGGPLLRRRGGSGLAVAPEDLPSMEAARRAEAAAARAGLDPQFISRRATEAQTEWCQRLRSLSSELQEVAPHVENAQSYARWLQQELALDVFHLMECYRVNGDRYPTSVLPSLPLGKAILSSLESIARWYVTLASTSEELSVLCVSHAVERLGATLYTEYLPPPYQSFLKREGGGNVGPSSVAGASNPGMSSAPSEPPSSATTSERSGSAKKKGEKGDGSSSAATTGNITTTMTGEVEASSSTAGGSRGRRRPLPAASSATSSSPRPPPLAAVSLSSASLTTTTTTAVGPSVTMLAMDYFYAYTEKALPRILRLLVERVRREAAIVEALSGSSPHLHPPLSSSSSSPSSSSSSPLARQQLLAQVVEKVVHPFLLQQIKLAEQHRDDMFNRDRPLSPRSRRRNAPLVLDAMTYRNTILMRCMVFFQDLHTEWGKDLGAPQEAAFLSPLGEAIFRAPREQYSTQREELTLLRRTYTYLEELYTRPLHPLPEELFDAREAHMTKMKAMMEALVESAARVRVVVPEKEVLSLTVELLQYSIRQVGVFLEGELRKMVDSMKGEKDKWRIKPKSEEELLHPSKPEPQQCGFRMLLFIQTALAMVQEALQSISAPLSQRFPRIKVEVERLGAESFSNVEELAESLLNLCVNAIVTSSLSILHHYQQKNDFLVTEKTKRAPPPPPSPQPSPALYGAKYPPLEVDASGIPIKGLANFSPSRGASPPYSSSSSSSGSRGLVMTSVVPPCTRACTLFCHFITRQFAQAKEFIETSEVTASGGGGGGAGLMVSGMGGGGVSGGGGGSGLSMSRGMTSDPMMLCDAQDGVVYGRSIDSGTSSGEGLTGWQSAAELYLAKARSMSMAELLYGDGDPACYTFVRVLGVCLFRGIGAHLKTFVVNDLGVLVYKQDVTAYAEAMRPLSTTPTLSGAVVKVLFQMLRETSGLLLIPLDHIKEVKDAGLLQVMQPAEKLAFLKIREDVRIAFRAMNK